MTYWLGTCRWNFVENMNVTCQVVMVPLVMKTWCYESGGFNTCRWKYQNIWVVHQSLKGQQGHVCWPKILTKRNSSTTWRELLIYCWMKFYLHHWLLWFPSKEERGDNVMMTWGCQHGRKTVQFVTSVTKWLENKTKVGPIGQGRPLDIHFISSHWIYEPVDLYHLFPRCHRRGRRMESYILTR